MEVAERCIFSGMKVLINYRWQAGVAVVVEEGKIKAILPEEMIANHLPATQHKFPDTYYLAPGFIDLHIHGANGSDVMDGEINAFKTIGKSLAAEGITAYLATTMTTDIESLEAVLTLIPLAMRLEDGAAVIGVHLEGPFIAESKAGAQQAAHIIHPDEGLVKKWQKLSEDSIRLLTLAPELPKAIDFIHALKKMGIIASIGHSNADYAVTMDAINAGCSQATHLFNAMRGIHQREPGAAGALLLSEKVSAELIADGMHLHPAIIDMAYRLKGRDGIMLVTDAMRAKCLGDGEYELGGQSVLVREGRAELKDGTLAGSTLRMNQAINNMKKFTGSSLEDAIYMASMNPARRLGLADRKGDIDVGKDADMVVLNADMDIALTMRAGKVVFSQ